MTSFWNRPNPRKTQSGKAKPARKLAPNQLEAARSRAHEAGRRYPNLVDNAWAARHVPPLFDPADADDADGTNDPTQD